MTEATATNQQTSAYDELMALMEKMEHAKRRAYKELQEATAAQHAAQMKWNETDFGLDAGIADEKDVKKAKTELEQADKRLEAATARFEASNRVDALSGIAQNEKVKALVEAAVKEAEEEMSKYERIREAELKTLEELKVKFLETAKRLHEAQEAEKEIIKQLQQVNRVIPGVVPQAMTLPGVRGFLTPWNFPAIDSGTIDRYVHSKQG